MHHVTTAVGEQTGRVSVWLGEKEGEREGSVIDGCHYQLTRSRHGRVGRLPPPHTIY